MPEGHSVRRLAGAFEARFVGERLAASSPQGRFEAGAAAIDGTRLRSVEARGKQMFLGFEGDAWVRVHLGMYGMWRFAGPGLAGYGRRSRAPKADPEAPVELARAEPGFPPAPRGAVRLRLVSAANVADLSGPTACELLDGAGRLAALGKLGEDPLDEDADPDRVIARLAGSRQPIALALMRQELIAGIGNIYRAEMLFRAGIDPFLPGGDLPPATFRAMWADLRALMEDGVRRGRIATVGADGDGGGRNPRARGASTNVAHRAGRPCLACGTAIREQIMGGRRLFWCPTCQPPGSAGRAPSTRTPTRRSRAKRAG